MQSLIDNLSYFCQPSHSTTFRSLAQGEDLHFVLLSEGHYGVAQRSLESNTVGFFATTTRKIRAAFPQASIEVTPIVVSVQDWKKHTAQLSKGPGNPCPKEPKRQSCVTMHLLMQESFHPVLQHREIIMPQDQWMLLSQDAVFGLNDDVCDAMMIMVTYLGMKYTNYSVAIIPPFDYSQALAPKKNSNGTPWILPTSTTDNGTEATCKDESCTKIRCLLTHPCFFNFGCDNTKTCFFVGEVGAFGATTGGRRLKCPRCWCYRQHGKR